MPHPTQNSYIKKIDALVTASILLTKKLKSTKGFFSYEFLKPVEAEALSLIEELKLLYEDIVSTDITLPRLVATSMKTTLRYHLKNLQDALKICRASIRRLAEAEAKIQKMNQKLLKNKAQSPTTISSALLAKFLVKEAVKLNKQYVSNDTIHVTRFVSSVPPSAFKPVEQLLAQLEGEVDTNQIDFLEGMNELT
jgi:predicted DNA-binding helix-hairpin-helix protein